MQTRRNAAAATASLLSSANKDLHKNEAESTRLHAALVSGLLQAYGQVHIPLEVLAAHCLSCFIIRNARHYQSPGISISVLIAFPELFLHCSLLEGLR